jgi:hypothetical protein
MMRSKKNLPACRSNPENGTQGISIAARHLHEECGVFGVYAKTRCDVAGLCYYALYALQHRGQESCGIVVNDDGFSPTYRDVGLVSQVFTKPSVLAALPEGSMAVGHVRYGTTGRQQAQLPAHRGEPPSRAAWHWPTTAISPTPWSSGRSWRCRAPFSTPPATRRSSPTS